MKGELGEVCALPWVENAFQEGMPCEQAYRVLWHAREELCSRFGLEWEDPALEQIMDAVVRLEWDIARRMFRYGLNLAKVHIDPQG